MTTESVSPGGALAGPSRLGAAVDQHLSLMPLRRCRFCRWAPEYETDKLSRILGGYQQQALNALQPTRDDTFLDVGCGTGAAVRTAARTVRTALGVDPCPRMIERAQRLASEHRPRAGFLLATAERLPVADRSITALLCTAAMRHISDRTAAVREMARVLAPGGRVVIGDFRPELAFTAKRSARARAQESIAVMFDHDELRVVGHTTCPGFLGPYLIACATKPDRGPGTQRRSPGPPRVSSAQRAPSRCSVASWFSRTKP